MRGWLIITSRNCTKSGGSGTEYLVDLILKALLTLAGYSVNYAIDQANFDIEDPESVLKTYQDRDTDSGNQIEVAPVQILSHIIPYANFIRLLEAQILRQMRQVSPPSPLIVTSQLY